MSNDKNLYSKEEIAEFLKGDESVRESVNTLMLENQLHQIVEDIHMKLLEANRILYLNSYIQGDLYYPEEKNSRDDENEKTYLIPRSQAKHGLSLSIQWHKKQFLQNKQGGWRVYGKAIPMDKTKLTYRRSLFDKEPQWVQVIGPDMEKHFQILRKQSALVTKIRQNLYELDKLTCQYFEDDMLVLDQADKRKEPISPSDMIEIGEDYNADLK